MSVPAVEPGFIRVECPACNNQDVWFKCNGCGKSDHFTVQEGSVRCRCGETYSSGVCTCGASVPFEKLLPVPFDKGPMGLADLEVAWGRVAGLVLLVVMVVSAVVFFFAGA